MLRAAQRHRAVSRDKTRDFMVHRFLSIDFIPNTEPMVRSKAGAGAGKVPARRKRRGCRQHFRRFYMDVQGRRRPDAAALGRMHKGI